MALLAIVSFCFWLFLYPFIPVVREMSQLFLWTGDYFVERIMIPGGLAQYLGEMISQFFFNPVNGAVAYTVMFIVAQQLSSRWLRQFFPSLKDVWRFVFSLVPAGVLWWLAMLPYVPLTLTMAVLLVMGAGCVIMSIRQTGRFGWRTGALMLAVPVMYWLTGPAAVLLVFCCIRWIPVTAVLFAACLVGSSWLTPYPLRQVARGIDYIDDEGRVGLRMSTYEEMECDMLFRQGRWEQIIRKFQHPVSPAVRSAVLMAYHKSGQADEKELMANLVVPVQQQENTPTVFNLGDAHFIVNFGSLTSAFMVSDIAMQLYWTNISQRAAFDAMEGIPNNNKSGRALKRLVETNIISGHYDTARKYIAVLEKTLVYRRWAQSMRSLLDHPETIKTNHFIHSAQKCYASTEDVFFI